MVFFPNKMNIDLPDCTLTMKSSLDTEAFVDTVKEGEM